jgi:imidazolonepropionase-like amidohydrolase
MSTIEALNSAGTYVDATITVGAVGADIDVDEAVLRRREQRTSMLPLFHRMHDSGVAILGGTDGGVPGVAHGQVAQAIIALHVEVGLPLGEALLSGTKRPAEAFGRGERLGSIRAGAQADLLLLDGDVVVDVSAVCRPAHVWSKGHLIVSHGRLVAGPPSLAPVRSS